MKIHLFLCFAILSCNTHRNKKYEIYIETSSSDHIRTGHYLHGGVLVVKGTYLFVRKNESTGITDTTIVRINQQQP